MTQIIRIPAKAVEIVKNKRTGEVYADKAAFEDRKSTRLNSSH